MADKKISELPLITTVSGSIVFVPIVHDGITEKITIQNFSKYTSQYSAHTGSAGNVFTGPQTINNNVTITGNQSVNGNVTISGRLTVHEVVAQYETASILFSTGSTKLGDQITDRHEFTGSTNITGSFLVNGANLSDFSASNSTLFTNYSSSVSESISSYSASNSTVFTNFSSSNAVISQIYSASNSTTFTNLSSSNSTTFTNFSSSNAVISQNISASNSTTFTTYSSSNSTTFTNYSSSNSTTFTTYSSSVSESISSYSASNSTTFTNFSSSNAVISQTYSASNSTTFTNFSSSNAVINQTISASNSTTFTNYSSSNAVISQTYSASNSTTFTNYSSSTATSINNVSTGVGSELSRVYQTTASLNTQTGSQGNLNAQIGIATGSLNTQTGSQESMNTTLSIVTGSMRAEIGGIEAYTASLKSAIIVNGTNVRIIGELTASRIYTEFITSSVLFVTGSNIIGDQSTDKHEFTGSVHINDTLFIKGIAQGTGELNAFTGSQINKDFTLSVVTSSLNAQTGSQQNLNAQIGIATGSLNSTTASLIGITNGLMALTASMKGQAIVSSSTQVQNYDVFALNSNLYNGTGSIKGEISGIEAYTASLKAAAIVSSSQQITNYYKFAETASANTFYGNQTFASSGGSGLRVYGAAGTHQWDVYLNGENLRISDNTAGDAALVVDTRASFTRPVTASALNLTKSPDGVFAELGGNTPKLNLYKFSSGNVMNIGHNYYYDGVAYGKNDISLQGWEFRSHITNGQYTISHSPAAVTTLNQLIKLDANNGDLTITNGNLVLANGKGIDFSATANSGSSTTSELLNDYEEGTWTPTVEAVTGTYTTVTNQRGTYTKIGRLVTVHFYFIVSNKGTGAGGFNITNLPYPVLPSAAGDAYIGSGINTSNSIMFNIQAIQSSTICSGYRYDGTDSIIATNGNNGTVTYITYS